MRSILSPLTKLLKLRPRIRRGPDIGAEACGIVDDQFAAAQEIDLCARAGRRGDFERAARLKLEEAAARRIDGRRCIERAGDVERPIVQHGRCAVGAGERPSRPGIGRERLEIAERAGAYSADRAGAAAAGKLERVGAAARGATLPMNTAPGSTTSRLVALPAKSMAYDPPEIVPAFVTVLAPPVMKTPKELPESVAPAWFVMLPPPSISAAAPLVAVMLARVDQRRGRPLRKDTCALTRDRCRKRCWSGCRRPRDQRHARRRCCRCCSPFPRRRWRTRRTRRPRWSRPNYS